MRALCHNILKLNKLNINPGLYPFLRYCTNVTGSYLSYEKDPGPLFINPETQKLLKSVTRVNLEKIFRRRNVINNLVTYKFMTTEEVENEINKLTIKADKYLQMPPVVQIVNDTHQIISNDPELKNYSDSSIVFTDITYGLKSVERKIVVRDIDGKLEKAPLSVRKRMNQIYFPLEGRKLTLPKIFEPEYLEQSINNKNYEFLLDWVCVQFEPYDREFHEISSKVYTKVNETKDFHDLRSTRHFGPLVFFLAWHKIIDNLLIDMIQRDYLQNGVELIALTYNLNNITYDKNVLSKLPQKDELRTQYQPFKSQHDEIIENSIGKTSTDFKIDDFCLEFIDSYVKEYSTKKPQLELVLQTYKESHEHKRKLLDGLNKAHGISN